MILSLAILVVMAASQVDWYQARSCESAANNLAAAAEELAEALRSRDLAAEVNAELAKLDVDNAQARVRDALDAASRACGRASR